jgi:carbonic anhydrase
MTFPFVSKRVEAGDLTLHGLWLDIAEGVVEQYLPAQDKFVPL